MKLNTKYIKQLNFSIINLILLYVALSYQYRNLTIHKSNIIISLILFSIVLFLYIFLNIGFMDTDTFMNKFLNVLLLLLWQSVIGLNSFLVGFKLNKVLEIILIYLVGKSFIDFLSQNILIHYLKYLQIFFELICFITGITLIIYPRLFPYLYGFIVGYIIMFSVYSIVLYRKAIKLTLKNDFLIILSVFIIYNFLKYELFLKIMKANKMYLGINLGWCMFITLPVVIISLIILNHSLIIKKYLYEISILVLTIFIFLCWIICVLLLDPIKAIFLVDIMCILFYCLYVFMIKQHFYNKSNYFKMMKNTHLRVYFLAKEEQLKNDFSKYLHDYILQDVLSIKNLIPYAHEKEISTIISTTLTDLSNNIRAHMNEYSPAILKSKTIKENYYLLIKTIEEKYPLQDIKIHFNCKKNLFLIKPYDIVVYRILHECCVNAFKHSLANNLYLSINQQNKFVKVIIKDDGICTTLKNVNSSNGLNFLKEQVSLLGGTIHFSINNPSGFIVEINFEMEGDNSYEHFISG